MNRRKPQNRILGKHERGFTLVEIMAVMFIIGLLVSVVTVGISSQVKKARIQAAKTQISGFEQAISTFHLECGFYPEALESLISPPTGRSCKGYPSEGFLSKKEIPADPWGVPYNYANPGSHNTDGYDIWSNGPDGEDGSSDDVTNWSTEAKE